MMRGPTATEDRTRIVGRRVVGGRGAADRRGPRGGKGRGEAFRNRRLGEAPQSCEGQGKLKPKASPTCVADFADLESGETLDVEARGACEQEIVYPRNPNRMKDEEATKRGEAIASITGRRWSARRPRNNGAGRARCGGACSRRGRGGHVIV